MVSKLIPSVCYIEVSRSETSSQSQFILLEAFPLAGGPQFETCSTLISFCSHLSGLNFAQVLLRVREFSALHDYGDGIKGAGFSIKEMG